MSSDSSILSRMRALIKRSIKYGFMPDSTRLTGPNSVQNHMLQYIAVLPQAAGKMPLK